MHSVPLDFRELQELGPCESFNLWHLLQQNLQPWLHNPLACANRRPNLVSLIQYVHTVNNLVCAVENVETQNLHSYAI